MSEDYTKTAQKLVDELRGYGFRGVRFEVLEIEGEDDTVDDYYGELTQETFDAMKRDTVAIIAQPEVPFFDEMAYTTQEFDLHKFVRDFKSHLKERFGPQASIRYSDGCFEYEITRSPQ